ncbi:MAG: hypothetical protein GDA54_03170 [Alphaproteobacteria bacterium GM7ARS4]|nr:hypothetical protein [Alphaproteobacteria bacterium GM7ARS4]
MTKETRDQTGGSITHLHAALLKAQNSLSSHAQRIAQWDKESGDVPRLMEEQSFPPPLLEFIEEKIREFIKERQGDLDIAIDKGREKAGLPLRRHGVRSARRTHRGIINV